MQRQMGQPEAYQIDFRLRQLNEFYSSDVMVWVLTCHPDMLLCDSERDAHRHAMNILESYDANEIMEAYERLYPEMIEFFRMKQASAV